MFAIKNVEYTPNTTVNQNPLHIYEPLLLNKKFMVAVAIAYNKGISLSAIKVDGKDIPNIGETKSNRMNVAVVDGIVVELLNWG